MPRIPLDDCLLTAKEAAAKVGVSRTRWYRYAKRYPLLCAGERRPHSEETGRGVKHWLNSAVVAHMHVKLGREMAEYEKGLIIGNSIVPHRGSPRIGTRCAPTHAAATTARDLREPP